MRRSTPLVLLLAGCAGCVPKREAPPPAPAPSVSRPAPPPAPLAADWQDWPLTPGDWAYRRDGRGSIALYGPPGADARFTLRCDRLEGALFLSRQGAPAAGAAMTVRTSSTTRALAAQATGGTPAYAAVRLPPRDPLVDAMGYSRGRFTVEVAGMPPLVLPSWAEVLRVAEDCR